MKKLLTCSLSLLFLPTGLLDAAIVDVTETGGDNEPTDTITAKWSGVTYNTTVNNEPVPGAAGTPYTVGLFGSGAPAFVDRNHAYSDEAGGISIPPYLTGQQYIMSGNDNRDNASYRLDVAIDAASRVYMLIDNRLPDGNNATPPGLGAGAMQWILDNGWQPQSTGNNRSGDISLPDEVPIDEGANGDINQYYSVYFQDFEAGTFQLFQADNAGRNMYGAVVVPMGDGPSAVVLATPTTISEGDASTLSWIIPEDATVATIEPGIGNILPLTTNGQGSIMVTPSVSTTYTLSIESPGGDATSEAEVAVRLIDQFIADSVMVDSGAAVTLSWEARSDTSLTISGIGNVDAQTVDGSGSLVVNPAEATSYTLTATVGEESATAELAIYVLPAGELFALIDLGATDGQPEPGAAGGRTVGAATNNTSGVNLAAETLVSDLGSNFTIAIDNVDQDGFEVGGIDWRDRGDGNGEPLTLLGEDLLKNNAGIIRVTLGGLPAGEYDVLSWHFDGCCGGQAEAISAFVTDAVGTAVDTGQTGTALETIAPNLNTTAQMLRHLMEFKVVSNGVDDVIIYFDSRAAIDTEVPLNGLRISSSGPIEPPRIVRIDVDETNDTVTIEWTSRAGLQYSVFSSRDLKDFENELADSLEGQNGTTSYTHPGIDASAIQREFYRVEETP